jgi:predicted RND superfamily exporter protein
LSSSSHPLRELIPADRSEVLRIEEEEAAGSRVWIGGNPLVKAQLSRGIQGDLEWIVPAVFVESSILLAFAFRSASAVVLPLLGILITAIWTIGTIGWAGRPINLVTASVPALLVAIGFAYATYVVAEYQETLRAAEKEGDRNLTDVTRRAVAAILLPALVASITTIQGFGSLAFTNITAVREFGLFSAAGVFYAFLIGVTFTPATLRLLGTRRPSRERAEGFLERFAERIARFDLRHSRAILLGAAVVFAVALAGALRLEVGSDYITQFPADSRIRRDFQAINQHLGGVSSLYVVIESSAPDAFAEPENLRELRSLQDWLRAQPEVGSGVGGRLPDAPEPRHARQRPAFIAIPDSERLVKQLCSSDRPMARSFGG